MHVAIESPIVIEALVAIRFAIPIRIGKARQLTLLCDVDLSVNDFEAEWFVQP
jgi:hypothetical protein